MGLLAKVGVLLLLLMLCAPYASSDAEDTAREG